MLDFAKLVPGEEIRVKIDLPEYPDRQFEIDVVFIDFCKKTGHLLCAHGSQRLSIPTTNVLGKVIRYVETKVVPF